MKLTTLFTCALALFVPASLFAAGNLQITEVYAGITGEDGTPDWFELTNLGDMSISTGGLFYDDESADPAVNAPLDDFTLAPGESAIFLQDGEAADIALFESVWGAGINVGIAAGGGGLSQNGDAVFIFDSNVLDANTNIIDSVSFDGFGGTATLEFTPAGVGTTSVVGVNGAYESNAFFNDNIGDAQNMITLVGSPGFAVPEPTAALLAALAACGFAARRV
ncbi:hypothetical protein MalM25_04270 [Planctomycetes bacterium MalM25]|nr:hypothetical protein MalM25_04270 [Planctomycetes bacterium MalM25]